MPNKSIQTQFGIVESLWRKMVTVDVFLTSGLGSCLGTIRLARVTTSYTSVPHAVYLQTGKPMMPRAPIFWMFSPNNVPQNVPNICPAFQFFHLFPPPRCATWSPRCVWTWTRGAGRWMRSWPPCVARWNGGRVQGWGD